MKKMNKTYREDKNTLAAYYTCMCNHLACACKDPYGGSDNASITQRTFEQIKQQEDFSWNE